MNHAARNAKPPVAAFAICAGVFLVMTGWLLAESQVAAESGQKIGFNAQIRPILSSNCIACHGPDEGSREADLRLDIRDGALSVLEPGEADDSELLRRVLSDDNDERMPPPEHGHSLTEEQIALLTRWINEGADYEKHWSFTPPSKEGPPQSKHAAWARNEIDQFIAAKLEERGLTPRPDCDPYRLIRRLALDLTGLPPSQELVDRYAANPTDEVYEEVVDELLAAPTFGEHWAAMWMDIARYADTMGYADDRARTIWPWRDWVIDAFNANMPYDQFTIEQIAGDLLPDATNDQKLATAFHRNTLCNTEGGTNDEEFRTIAIKDRISTTINAWMGLTIRCAECHSHKYDPISQVEYYQFLDFFNQTADNDERDDRPRLEVFGKGREAELARLDEQIAAAREEAKSSKVWRPLHPVAALSRDGSEFEVLEDESIVPVGECPDFDEYRFTFRLPRGKHKGLRLEVLPDERTDGNTGRSEEGGFVISQLRAALVTKGEDGDKWTKETPIKLARAVADHSQVNFPVHLAIRDKVDEKGWAVNHPQDGYRSRSVAVVDFEKGFELDQPARLKFYILHKSQFAKKLVGRVRVSSTNVAKPANKYKQGKLDPLQRKLDDLVKQRDEPQRVPVLQEREEEQRRDTFVHLRGNYLSHGEQVASGVPKALHSLPDSEPKNRLGVARWLVSADNPLTARVTVNRFWGRLFGMGIVETEEDFGTQGARPTNQPLLDWLAVDFQENGWNVKRLLKKVVTSSAYRQDSRATYEHLENDPRNLYLARGPRFRLSAEVVRDQTLAVAGLLSSKQYGPPVYPTNPVKRIRSAFGVDEVWKVSLGEDRYRRALYTYLKRNAPHPLFETFDMASRTVCNMRRIRTNTPLQSFMTLNDETYIQAAKRLAEKMRSAGEETEDRIRFGLQTALLRPAGDDQVATLTELYETTLAEYQADASAAAELIGDEQGNEARNDAGKGSTAELASLTVVANVIMNLDEFLTK